MYPGLCEDTPAELSYIRLTTVQTVFSRTVSSGIDDDLGRYDTPLFLDQFRVTRRWGLGCERRRNNRVENLSRYHPFGYPEISENGRE